MSHVVLEFLRSQPGVAVAVGSLAALAAALVHVYTRHYPGQEEDEPEPGVEHEPRRLRMRPLKPAIDLRIYTYGDQ